MSNADFPENPDAQKPKESLKSLILRMANPLELVTEGLGRIQARNPTAMMEAAFLKRQPTVENVGDFDLVRTYMGCVTGIPESDQDTIADPLTEDQAALLTSSDVHNFATAYLEHFVKPEVISDPLAQLAAYVREEHKKAVESQADLSKTIKESLDRLSGTADIMRNWRAIQDNIEGPADRAKREIQKFMESPLFGGKALSDALSSIQRDRAALDLSGPNLRRDLDAIGRIDPETVKPLRGPQFPPFEETGPGRTMLAVEGLNDIGLRMQDSMGFIVEQVGDATKLIGAVTEAINRESRTFQEKSDKQTKSAMTYAKVSLAVSAAALVVSALFSAVGYKADRRDAASGDESAARALVAMQAQNKALEEVIRQQGELLIESRKQTDAAKGLPKAIEALGRRLPEPSAPATAVGAKPRG